VQCRGIGPPGALPKDHLCGVGTRESACLPSLVGKQCDPVRHTPNAIGTPATLKNLGLNQGFLAVVEAPWVRSLAPLRLCHGGCEIIAAAPVPARKATQRFGAPGICRFALREVGPQGWVTTSQESYTTRSSFPWRISRLWGHRVRLARRPLRCTGRGRFSHADSRRGP
jgi:hypothetical protein